MDRDQHFRSNFLHQLPQCQNGEGRCDLGLAQVLGSVEPRDPRQQAKLEIIEQPRTGARLKIGIEEQFSFIDSLRYMMGKRRHTMTDLLYQTDSNIREFEAMVVTADPETNAVELNRTAFFPGGGGQPHDLGWLAVLGQDTPVTRVFKQDDRIWHVLESKLPAEGSVVLGRLDWARRYALMRTHTALHILCGVVWRDYGAQVTGGNMDPLEGRMDFEFQTMRQELVTEIETRVNREVEAARPIRVAILPRQEAFGIPDLIRTKINLLPEGIRAVRIVEIVGLDLQADGGTHVASTQEVGRMRVADYKSKGKINKRIYISLEDRAIDA